VADRRWKPVLIGIGTLLLFGAVFAAMQPILAKLLRKLRSYVPLPVYAEPMAANGAYSNVIFLHHSTGRALIAEGDVRPLFTELGYQFWDHGYNHEGLVRPDGTPTGSSYRIPGNRGQGNTDVDGLAALFSQPVSEPPRNAFSRLLQHEVIVIKSCFPNSAIQSDDMQEQFRTWYLLLRSAMDQHPEHVFVIVTSPPLHPLATNADEARRARAVADWLKSNAYLDGHPNVFVFDFFDLLANPSANTLRPEYQLDPDQGDSHPNLLANRTIGPLFVTFVDEAVQSFAHSQSSSP
jgi:hypothetical protein